MKAAYPLMSGFAIWLLSVTGASAFLKIAVRKIKQKRILFASGAVILLLIFSLIQAVSPSLPVSAAAQVNGPVHLANKPFGTAQGILPGRVVWSWNPDATNEKCSNDIAQNDGYYLEKNSNQKVIDVMLMKDILAISGEKNLKQSWDEIFKYFNEKKGKGRTGYQPGQTIFIKINLGCANWSTEKDLSRREGSLGYSETSPQIVLALLNQLVNVLKIPQSKIIVADPMSHIYSDYFDILYKKFPEVIYGDRNDENVKYGRTLLHAGTDPVIFYSDKGSVLNVKSDCIYTEMQDADYLINIAALKAHGCAGITLTAKNHFGSITRRSASELHKALIGERNDQPYRVDYGMYRVQVDLMGSSYLGLNTLLFIVDGLWGGPEATMAPVKWSMAPFINDWPNSIFVSLDQVALESVCFDFLRNESSTGSPEWKNRPNMAQSVDDYLHQAASREFWPKGMVYDPDGRGVPINSLGVHEHWNNAIDKKYSGNYGNKHGIELISIFPEILR